MSFNVGDLIATLSLDDAAFKAGVHRTQANIRALDSRLNVFSQGLTRTTTQAVSAAGSKIGQFTEIVHRDFGKVEAAAPKMAAGMARAQNALTGLAIASSGANPHLAKLSIALAGLAMGGPVVAGLLVAGAAITTVWSKMKEDSVAVTGAIEEQIKKFKELALVQAFGAKAPHLTSIANAQASQQLLREKIQERGIDMANDAGKMGVGGQLSGVIANDPKLKKWIEDFRALGAGIEMSRAEIAKIDAELGKEAGEAAAGIAELDTRLNLLRATLPQLVADVNRMMATRFGTGAAANAGFAGGIEADLAAQAAATVRRQNQARALGRISAFLAPTTAAPTGAIDAAKWTDKFRDAVDAFGGGVKDMVKGMIKGAFSPEGMKNLGASLAGSGLAMAGNLIVDGLRSHFFGLSSAQKQLAKAIEQNTQALRADGAFLRKRLEALGTFVASSGEKLSLGQIVGPMFDAISDVLNRFFIGELGPDGIAGALKAALGGEGSMLNDFLSAIAGALGIDLSTLDPETLEQLLQALSKAGFGLDSLADTANDTAQALRNLPEGFKIAQAVFDATVGASVAGLAGASAAGIVVNQYGDNYFDARSKPASEVYDEWVREDAHRQARGGGSGFRGRGPS